MRNAMDAQEIAVGWWPGDARYGKAAFYAYAHPAPTGFAGATLSPTPPVGTGPGRIRPRLGRRLRRAGPARTALEFARSAFGHACMVCDWDPALLASTEGTPPPVR